MTVPSCQRLLLQTVGFLLYQTSWGNLMVVQGTGMPLYLNNPATVVRNLMSGDTYEEIYLQYHRCVWSEYGNGADGGYDNGCGGDGNENYWYMGRTPCFRANVAYSLYGVPKGESTPNNPCQRKQYINSFFTTNGVETFAESMGIEDYGYATDQCTVYSGGDADGNARRNLANTNNARLYPNYSSYTTYCAADGSFVQGLFQDSSYCTGSADVTTLGEALTEFNTAVDNMVCIPIFTATSNADDQNNEMDVYGLLSYSDPCSPLEYPNSCPDPYAAKKSSDFRPKSQQSLWKQMNWMDHVGWVFLVLSALCFLIPCCNLKDNDEEEHPKRNWCWRRQSNKDGENRGFRQWFRTKILRRRKN